MNTKSKYIARAIPKEEKQKQITFHKNIAAETKPHSLIIPKQTFKVSNELCSKTTYPINKIILTDYKLLEETKVYNISVCIYRLNDCRHNNISQTPFIQYLLYKYSPLEKKEELRDICIFPFVSNKKGQSSLQAANQLCFEITNVKLKSEGFLKKNNKIYFFYNIDSNKKESAKSIKYHAAKNELWWVLIDEICNHQKILNFPIHSSVYNLFYQYPQMIYLRDEKNERIDIPSVGYIGSYYKLLPSIALSVGSETKIDRDFGSFVYAVRYGGWTRDFKEQMYDNEAITNKNGRFTQGGLVRFALFLEKTTVIGITKHNLEKFLKHPDEWKKKYNAIFFGRISFKHTFTSDNPHFQIKTFNQQIPLSLHWLDMKTLKKWDPLCETYKIE